MLEGESWASDPKKFDGFRRERRCVGSDPMALIGFALIGISSFVVGFCIAAFLLAW